MAALNALPAIDVLEGRVVRLAQGDFDRVTDFGDDPVAIARAWDEAGAKRLHLVSLDGARDGGDQLVDIVRTIADATDLEIQAGGGVRSPEMIGRVSEAGADRVIIGSAAIADVRGVTDWLADYGPGALILALDVKLDDDNVPVPVMDGWRQAGPVNLWHLLDHYCTNGLQHLLCTDVARDGIGAGPNLQLYQEILARYPSLALQASGGVATLADVEALRGLGVAGVVVGRALHDRTFGIESFMEACA